MLLKGLMFILIIVIIILGVIRDKRLKLEERTTIIDEHESSRDIRKNRYGNVRHGK